MDVTDSTTEISFSIETEVTSAYYGELLKYVHENFVLPIKDRLANVRQTVGDGLHILNFTALGPNQRWHIDVEVKTGRPIRVLMTPSDTMVPQSALDRLREDLTVVVRFFEEQMRRSTLYFAWVEGREVVPERSPLRRARIFERIFLGNILFLFVFFIAISVVLFFFLGLMAALVIVGFQFLTILLSDRIIGVMADWRVTEKNAKVHMLQYHLSPQQRRGFQKRYSREKLLRIKKEIYDKTLAVGDPIEREIACEIMAEHGLKCQPESMATKTIDVYQLVRRTTERFGLPIPKIVVSNTMVPNAAAAGPSPRHGIILVTTGLLVQLKEEEILSVLGHELSHLNARDPLVLSGLVASEYLLRIFVLWGYIRFFGLVYLLFIMGAIYFVAKFFEARADLESAIRIGKPKILASALRKIGFRRLHLERARMYRIQDWITWNPHPPLYFRVARLEGMEIPVEVRHTLIRSAKDCMRGFLAAF